MKKLLIIISSLVLGLSPSIQAANKPNVLIIMADDCTYNDLALYGGQNSKTPNGPGRRVSLIIWGVQATALGWRGRCT
jgi:hypothetical protein